MASENNPNVRLERFNPKKHDAEYANCCRGQSNWSDVKTGPIPQHPAEYVVTIDFGGKPWVAGHCSEHLAAYMDMHRGVGNALVLHLASLVLPKA